MLSTVRKQTQVKGTNYRTLVPRNYITFWSCHLPSDCKFVEISTCSQYFPQQFVPKALKQYKIRSVGIVS